MRARVVVTTKTGDNFRGVWEDINSNEANLIEKVLPGLVGDKTAEIHFSLPPVGDDHSRTIYIPMSNVSYIIVEENDV
jgi:hypothetical protein